jgi:GntR family transcriptional regulator
MPYRYGHPYAQCVAGETSENPESGALLYKRIADELRTAITSGEYLPGHALPSVTQLMERYGVSRSTVQTALSMLRAEGLTENRYGAGTVVRARPTVIRLARNRLSRAERAAGRGAFMSDAAAGGFTPTTEVTVRTEPADEHTAAALGIAIGDEVLVRDRVMSADGVPIQLATSRLPRTITRGTRIEDEDTGPGGTYGRLEENGHHLDHAVESVRSRPATAEESARLGLPAGAPVFAVDRIAVDTAGRPVEVNRMVMAGERYELVYEIDMD